MSWTEACALRRPRACCWGASCWPCSSAIRRRPERTADTTSGSCSAKGPIADGGRGRASGRPAVESAGAFSGGPAGGQPPTVVKPRPAHENPPELARDFPGASIPVAADWNPAVGSKAGEGGTDERGVADAQGGRRRHAARLGAAVSGLGRPRDGDLRVEPGACCRGPRCCPSACNLSSRRGKRAGRRRRITCREERWAAGSNRTCTSYRSYMTYIPGQSLGTEHPGTT